MTTDCVTRTTCRICAFPALRAILTLPETPLGDSYLFHPAHAKTAPRYPLDLVICDACGLVQLRHTVDPALVYSEALYQTSISHGLPAHFDDYAGDVIARTATPRDSFVIDVGSNDGTLLRAFQRHGMRVLGIDPSEVPAAKANANGQPTITAFLSADVVADVLRQHGPAQIITVNNLLANVDDLPRFAAHLAALLAPEGTLIIETGYGPDLVEHLLIDVIYHEHLSYFSAHDLMVLMQAANLRLVRAERIATKGGSLRVYAHHAMNRSADPVTVHGILNDEAESSAGLVSSLQSRSDRLRDAVGKQLDPVSGVVKYGDLAGYGASCGVTTLLYYFNLMGRIAYLVDDDPIRFGRYSPGLGVPVLSSQALYLPSAPRDVLILAWRYAPQIQARHPEFRGRFHVPLPTFTTLRQEQIA